MDLATKQFVIGCLPEYRRRNGKFIKWLKDNDYIDYYNEVVYDLTPEQQANETLYPGNCTQDLRYDRLNVKMTMTTLSVYLA